MPEPAAPFPATAMSAKLLKATGMAWRLPHRRGGDASHRVAARTRYRPPCRRRGEGVGTAPVLEKWSVFYRLTSRCAFYKLCSSFVSISCRRGKRWVLPSSHTAAEESRRLCRTSSGSGSHSRFCYECVNGVVSHRPLHFGLARDLHEEGECRRLEF
ncbi:uncharacterized protein LOC119361990 [Triticum dicoccoides]|uniref:uncharacterized protein LOC119361990 n=1 Tax=Triticum dicoccoides TaxID=85692 RepID=UPI00188FBCE5|nr:uncharacterized protein LOC119361990 [Triticum dicoccoides]